MDLHMAHTECRYAVFPWSWTTAGVMNSGGPDLLIVEGHVLQYLPFLNELPDDGRHFVDSNPGVDEPIALAVGSGPSRCRA